MEQSMSRQGNCWERQRPDDTGLPKLEERMAPSLGYRSIFDQGNILTTT